MSLKKNLVANYLGQGWTAVMQVAFIPVYIKYMGIEAYGLIGLFTVLQAGLALLDMGMTPTLNREMTRYTSGAHTHKSIRELLFSLEVISILIVVVIAGGAFLTSDWLAHNWLKADDLPLDTVEKSIALMGAVAALRFMEGIYRGTILGLQNHVWLNTAGAIFGTARGFGVVGVLIWISPSIEAFFVWQAFVSLLSVLVFANYVHKKLPKTQEAIGFSVQGVISVWDFAKGMIATTFFSLILTQVDKILLSQKLSLREYGSYALAALVANSITLLVLPIAQSYYPRFTSLVELNDKENLIKTYHQGSQLMTIAIMPFALLLLMQSKAILYIWTQDISLAESAAQLVCLLSLGTAMLGIMNMPYMLQLAYGWSAFAAKVNAIIVIVQVPTLVFAVQSFGAIGAAWIWVAINASYILFVTPIMHHYILPSEKWNWYFRDNLLPICSAGVVGLLFEFIMPTVSDIKYMFIILVSQGAAMFVAAFLAAKDIRKIALNFLNKRIK